jgi:hypothetical protein
MVSLDPDPFNRTGGLICIPRGQSNCAVEQAPMIGLLSDFQANGCNAKPSKIQSNHRGWLQQSRLSSATALLYGILVGIAADSKVLRPNERERPFSLALSMEGVLQGTYKKGSLSERPWLRFPGQGNA